MYLKLKPEVRAFPGRKVGIRDKNGNIDYDSQVMITHRGLELSDSLGKEILKQNPNLVVKGTNPNEARKKKAKPKADLSTLSRKELIAMAKEKGYDKPVTAKTVDLVAFLEG